MEDTERHDFTSLLEVRDVEGQKFRDDHRRVELLTTTSGFHSRWSEQ
jgi:hypothetical protein